jgi:hypothetical protein
MKIFVLHLIFSLFFAWLGIDHFGGSPVLTWWAGVIAGGSISIAGWLHAQ